AVIIRNGACCCIKHEAYIFQDNFRHVRCTRTRFGAMNFITVQIGRSHRVPTSHRICNRQRRNWRDLY
ncbi:unnamed protein product, partial [Tenebrio molitor]